MDAPIRKQISSYETVLHGQPVTVRVFEADKTPVQPIFPHHGFYLPVGIAIKAALRMPAPPVDEWSELRKLDPIDERIDWYNSSSLPDKVIANRLARGWDPDRARNEPVQRVLRGLV